MADHLNGKVAILVGASCVGPGWGNRSGAIANVSSVAAIRYTGYRMSPVTWPRRL